MFTSLFIFAESEIFQKSNESNNLLMDWIIEENALFCNISYFLLAYESF